MSLNTLEFLASQAASAIRRNPLVSLAAVTNVAVGLSILGGFALLALNLNHMADLEANSAVVTCELADSANPADVEAALLADMRVKNTKFLSKTDALGQLAEKNKLDLGSLKLLANPLPNSILVRVKNPEQIEAVRAAAANVKGVKVARYPKQVTQKILIVARGVKIAGLVVGSILALAILTVINTTIRLTIYARRREIRIMQLVGATRWFIRLPFLLEGMFHGLVGGIAAAALVLVSYSYVHDYVAQNLDFVKLMYDSRMATICGASLLAGGLLFGAIGSITGVHKYLRLV
jgi:cell division transport system permease protein